MGKINLVDERDTISIDKAFFVTGTFKRGEHDALRVVKRPKGYVHHERINAKH